MVKKYTILRDSLFFPRSRGGGGDRETASPGPGEGFLFLQEGEGLWKNAASHLTSNNLLPLKKSDSAQDSIGEELSRIQRNFPPFFCGLTNFDMLHKTILLFNPHRTSIPF